VVCEPISVPYSTYCEEYKKIIVGLDSVGLVLISVLKGVDSGFGSSGFGVVVLEYSDHIIKVVYSDQIMNAS
jgi:hypothetical protein